jgi:hypothetical protein
MDNISANFDLHATIQAVQQAIVAVTCHMLFSFALHGLFLAFVVAALGFLLAIGKHRFAPSLIKVAQRTSIFCLLLALPGIASLIFFGKLPDAGVFNFNSVGLICLWSLIYLHLSAAEIYSAGLNVPSSAAKDCSVL